MSVLNITKNHIIFMKVEFQKKTSPGGKSRGGIHIIQENILKTMTLYLCQQKTRGTITAALDKNKVICLKRLSLNSPVIVSFPIFNVTTPVPTLPLLH